MKRLLAVLLALTMTLTCAPLSALAASDDTLAKRITVEQTTQPDAELVQAIAADPFMQPVQASAPQQEQSASVDSSDISMTATNSFGKLLLDGMNGNEEENGTEFSDDNRVIGIKMNGGTATVEYVAAEAADLVVAVYTDSAAEEMVASGTVSAPTTADNTGSSTVQVPVEGSIPEYYTVKAYLLDKAEHAPLSKVFTDTSKTEAIVDIKNAQVGDFDPDRVINLDDDNTTNFMVVNSDVTLIDEKNSDRNHITESDLESNHYTFEKASAEVKSLKEGDIFVYQYDEQIIVLRVENVICNGDTVEIQGNTELELEDVFNTIKIEEDIRNGEVSYEPNAETGVVKGYGDEADIENSIAKTEEVSFLDEENSVPDKPDGAHDFGSGFETEIPLNDEKNILEGNVKFSLSGKVTYYLSSPFRLQYYNFEVEGEVSLNGEIKKSTPDWLAVKLIPLGVSLAHGAVKIGIEPELKLKVEVTGSVYLKITTSNSFYYANGNPGADGETKVEAGVSLKGKLYVGLDLAPYVRIIEIANIGSLAELEMEASVGGEAKFTLNVDDLKVDSSDTHSSKHGCGVCFKIEAKIVVNISVSFKILEKSIELKKSDESTPDNKGKVTIFTYDVPFPDAYYSWTYKEFGWGECKHKAYRVTVTVEDPDGKTVDVRGKTLLIKDADDKLVKEETFDENNQSVFYLNPGAYKASITIDGTEYVAGIPVTDGSKEIVIKQIKSDSGSSGGETDGESSGTCGDNLTWTLSADGTLTISGNGPMKDYDSEEHGHRYDRPWEKLCDKIKVVVLENGVTSTGDYAFADCKNLVTISMADTVTSVSFGSFYNCPSLEEVTIPENVTIIGYCSFNGCINLKKVTIPKAVKVIDTAAFGVRNLKDVYYGGTVEEWKNIKVWQGNDVLNNATIHCTDGDIERKENFTASGNCGKNITWTLDVDGTLTISGTGEMPLYYNYPEWHDYAEDVKAVIIDPRITTIGDYAFDGCTNLSGITIPDGVTKVGYWAFGDCKNLQDVVIPTGVTEIGDYAFADCKSFTDIVIPAGVTEIGMGIFSNCTSLKSVELPDGVTRIGEQAFMECSALRNITIPSEVKSIGVHAFSGSALTSITLPDGVEEIGDAPFFECRQLKNVVIGGKLTSIGVSVFYGCDSLESITMPNTVTTIGEKAFYCCDSLKHITVFDAAEKKDNDGVIGKEAFYGCKNLEEITIPDGVASIGEYAFAGCQKLTEVVIPDSVTSIGKSAFHWCDNLTKVVLPAGITEVPEAMFCFDYKLTEAVIPETVTSIGSFAFADCQSLTSINIPNGVTSIGEETFRKCESLTDVYYDGTKEQWQAISIDSTENDALLNATIHCTDGDITPETDSTNAISFGTTTQSSETYHALFSGLTAGEDYTVIVSRSAEQPLKAENLAYIIQLPAGADGTLDVKFKAQNAEDLSYVVACRRGEDRHSIEVTHGRSSDAEAVRDKQVTITAEDRGKEGYKFSKWAVLSGDVTLANVEQAETTFVMGCQDVKLEAIYVREGHSIRAIDGTADKNTAYKDEKVTITAKDRSSEGKTFVKWNVLAGGVTLADASSPSTTFVMGTQEVTVQAVYQAANTNPGTSGGSGGGGGGGGAIALIGGAAVVAGVVAMLPAKVSGVVLSADAVLPNAAVQLVQKGAVVAQTVTDANGSFTLKAKRGAYQLNITYQDAAGQPVTQSVAVTAPAENLTLRF